nr:DUF6266 family protein [uncultured Pedobacter sp.]
MGQLKNGILGGVTGKVGTVTGYQLNGQEIIRSNGKNNKPPTEKQLNNRQQLSVLMEFFKKMEPLLKTGFDPETRGTTKNYHNLAIFYNKPRALKGYYPNVEIDYPKIRISYGGLSQAFNPTVEMVTEGLKFSWDIQHMIWQEKTDRVMLLAYAPISKLKCFTNSGSQRIERHDILEISPSMRNEPLEIYMAFVSDDRLNASISQYLGRFEI